MMPATSENEKVRFHTLNRETQNRVVSHYVASVTGKQVKDEDEVKGYQRGENDYVMLEDEELENVALDSTKTIDISTFTPRDSIEWIWLETPYYLSPNDPVGQEAFSVIRDAMESQDMVGISRLVITRRERAVMLEPRGKGIVLWTLRYGDEVRDEDTYFAGIGDETADSDMMPLVQQLRHVGFCDVLNSTTRPATRVGSIWPKSRSALCADSVLTTASTTATCSKVRFRHGSVVEPIAVPKSDGCSRSTKRAKKWQRPIRHQCSTSQNLGDETLAAKESLFRLRGFHSA
jgi:DNA end-binding protein Ku